MVSISYLDKHFNFEKITMLKIRTFILALSFTPLLALNSQLPSHAESPSVGGAGSMSGGAMTGSVNSSPSLGGAGSMSGGGCSASCGNTISNPDDNTSPSLGNGGSMSGGGTTGSNGNTNSNPDENTSASLGNGGSMSGGGTTGSNGNTNSNPSVGEAGGQSGGGNNEGNNNDSEGPVENLEPKSPALRIERTRRGNIIRIKTDRQRQLNLTATRLLTTNSGTVFIALVRGSIEQNTRGPLLSFLEQAGVRPTLGRQFTLILFNLFRPRRASSDIIPSFTSAQLPEEELLASNKALKSGLIIAQVGDTKPKVDVSGTQPSVDVDINQLNNAINTYNQMIKESSSVTLQALLQNQDFVEIGKALKELRVAVN